MRTIGVSIAVPEPYGGELQRWRALLGDPNAESIPAHVTLLPPVEVEPTVLPDIERHLSEVASAGHPFRIRLRGTGTFRPVSPVVFIALAEGISSCERLADAVGAGPAPRTLRFPYHPHVTIAHDLPEHMLDKAFEVLADFHCAFTVEAFSMFELGADSVWRPQRDFTLGGPLPRAQPLPQLDPA